MNNNIKLIDLDRRVIFRGNIFRLPANYPYEDMVDFMVFDNRSEERPYGLIVSSGYKSGLILVELPKESCHKDGGLDRQWIVSNWKKWIYSGCDVGDVYLIDGYFIKD